MLRFRKVLAAKKFMDKREVEVSRFSFEKFLCHSAEKICRGTLKGVTDFGYTIFRRIFFVSEYRNISCRNPCMLCLRSFLVAKKIIDKKGSSIKIFCGHFLSHSVEKIGSGTLQCVINF